MSNVRNVDILISGIHLKVAGMVAQDSSLSDELVAGLPNAAIALYANKNAGNAQDVDKDILAFFSDSKATLDSMFEQLEAMRHSVFLPYSKAVDEMTKQGAFDELERYTSEATALYPDLTPLSQPLSATDLVAYCSILSTPEESNPVKAFMALFDALYDKMERDDAA